MACIPSETGWFVSAQSKPCQPFVPPGPSNPNKTTSLCARGNFTGCPDNKLPVPKARKITAKESKQDWERVFMNGKWGFFAALSSWKTPKIS
jgi:hypothetical protein